ncbi:MAG: DNA repair protein RecO C-terminal domain-containing protein [Muribaculaceae bacterium]|nr:DNA repair protein RecO C-terminal domain-containing protein [Muribaculaceae bacterium]
MLRSLHCIALRTIKYNEKHSILSAYSLEMGRVSFLLPAGSGREAARRRALMMPLGTFECVADIRHGQDIYIMKEPKADIISHGIHSNPIKSALALFIAELLSVVLREYQEDKALFLFLRQSIERLNDATEGVANFHLCFLYRLGCFVGIEPDVSTYQEGRIFDMVDGIFRVSAPLHSQYLGQQEAAVVALLSRMTFDNMHRFRLSRENRNQMLDVILEYYTIHYASLSSLKSIDVLRALF